MNPLKTPFRSGLSAALMALVVFATGGAAFASLAIEGAAPDEPKVAILNASQVYYPVPVKRNGKYVKPAVVTTATIFDAIKEWQEIKRRSLDESDAEYHLLLKKANDKFDTGLQNVRRTGSYDIVAEHGAISCENCTATDVTQDVVNALP